MRPEEMVKIFSFQENKVLKAWNVFIILFLPLFWKIDLVSYEILEP